MDLKLSEEFEFKVGMHQRSVCHHFFSIMVGVVIELAKCGRAKFRECSILLYGRFPSKLNGTIYKSYVRPENLHGSEACCLKES